MRCLPLALIALVACGGQKDAPRQVTSMDTLRDTMKPGAPGPIGHRYGTPTGKIRVANLLELGGKPSG
ncbi:MAG TPA: hypothetical protein VK807_03905, partial [Gemmatimonadaceae bacterium]|nr:hypothetical protein [Gemmatimonadaceae bacterium]